MRVDDCLYALQPTISLHLTRSSLGFAASSGTWISRLPQVERRRPRPGPQRSRLTPEVSAILHIDIRAQFEPLRASFYLLVAIDRTSKLALASELHET